MNYDKIMNAIKQWDNRSSQWFFRHFYLMFFQIILVGIFVIFFISTINTINLASETTHNNLLERLILSQNIVQLMMIFLMILNSFWMLILLASVFRIRSLLKNIDFSLSRRSISTQKRHED